MTLSSNLCRGFRFPAEVIEHAVWLYRCFSLRDMEAMDIAFCTWLEVAGIAATA